MLLVAYGLYAMLTSGKEATDDAQVAADVVPVASRIAGQVTAVHVVENQTVHKGDLIAEIDPRDAEVKLAQAQSDLDTAQAQAAQADANATVMQAILYEPLIPATVPVRSSVGCVGRMRIMSMRGRALCSTSMISTSNRSGRTPWNTVSP